MCKVWKTTYPLWQYPIIFLWLLWYLIKIKFKISAVIAWRREIGIIPKDRKVNFSDIISFGHWAAGETMNDWWKNKHHKRGDNIKPLFNYLRT